MSVAAVTVVKDEIDVLPFTLAHMLTQVDFVIVADNGSSDGTRDMLNQFVADNYERVYVQDDPEVGHFQGRKMSALAAEAAEMGADWTVCWDADEVWYSPFGRVADVLSETDAAVVTAPIYNHRATGVDPDDPNPLTRMGWRERDPLPLVKVACRPSVPVTVGEGNHGASYPVGVVEDVLVVRHFPIRSAGQMVSKARNGAAALAATSLPEDVGAHWRQWGQLSDEQLADVFRTYYWSEEPSNDLIFDPAPLSSSPTVAVPTGTAP